MNDKSQQQSKPQEQAKTDIAGSIQSYIKNIQTGPGTVPVSNASITTTSLKDLIKASKEASKIGVFDTEEKENESK